MSRDRESTAINQVLRPAVFFDRDGVLNVDSDYLFEIDKFRWIDGAIEAVKAINDAGYFAFVITNQSGVARGFYQEADIHRLHDWMAEQLAAHGSVAPYRRGSDRRKPQPGMIVDLLRKFPVDASKSFVVGDRPSDIEAARAAGMPGHLFAGGNLRDFILPLLARG
jgi:D-glycero-D-manno-heptose 1,7-bisphosphate phosphatase